MSKEAEEYLESIGQGCVVKDQTNIKIFNYVKKKWYTLTELMEEFAQTIKNQKK